MRTHLMALSIAWLAMSMQLPAQEVASTQTDEQKENGWNGLKKPNWVSSSIGESMP